MFGVEMGTQSIAVTEMSHAPSFPLSSKGSEEPAQILSESGLEHIRLLQLKEKEYINLQKKSPFIWRSVQAGIVGELGAATPARCSFPAALWLAHGEQAPTVFISHRR